MKQYETQDKKCIHNGKILKNPNYVGIKKERIKQTRVQHKEKWKKNKQTQCQQNEGNNKDQRRNKIEVKNDRQDQ